MRYFSMLIFVFLSFSFLSCNLTKQSSSNPSSDKPGEVISGLRVIADESFSLPSCSGNDCCSQSLRCIKQCDSLFSIEKETKEKCLKLPEKWVAQMGEILDTTLTNPNKADLEKIELPVLWSVVEMSEKPWLTKISDYSRAQAQAVLSWLAYDPYVSSSTFKKRAKAARLTLIALFRKNKRSPLVDDNAILSGLQSSIEEEKNFLEIAERQNNEFLISLVHKEVIEGHLCDYPINQPQPTTYSSESAYEACILAVYCHLTGSYHSDQYLGKEDGGRGVGQRLRKTISTGFEDKAIEEFIESPVEKGGLAVMRKADDWTDEACTKLTEFWNDQNLKFNL